jgi:hypothetical protein
MLRVQEFLFSVNVGHHGVEQAFMPAVKLLKKSASAAEGMANAQAEKRGNPQNKRTPIVESVFSVA